MPNAIGTAPPGLSSPDEQHSKDDADPMIRSDNPRKPGTEAHRREGAAPGGTSPYVRYAPAAFDRRTALFSAAAAVLATGWLGRTTQAAALDDTVEKAFQQYRERIAELVAWCRDQGLAEQADRVQSQLQPFDTNHIYLTALAENRNPDPPAEDAPETVKEWFRRWMSLRREQADKLLKLAQTAARQGHMSLALELLLAAVHENPDHPTIRRLLGYRRYGDRWCTQYELQRRRAGEVWDDRFGWIHRSALSRYEEGKREYRGRWISAEQEAQLRSDIRNGWTVETEHYRVLTNHSLEMGARLARELEMLYQVWSQLFVGFYATAAQVAAMFERRIPRQPTGQRHQVVYYRSRDEYLAALRTQFPQIEVSVGIYVGNTRTAYFYDDDGLDHRTVFHEATHQLFSEMRRPSPETGHRGNFWIIEGVAMYMETLRQEGPFYVLGEPNDQRMIAARYRFLKDDFYIPLAEFCTMTMDEFQQDPRIAVLYSQAAGLTHFLIHHDGGRFRDAVALYLSQVYAGRDQTETLSRLCETSFDELDKLYAQYLKSLPPLPPGLRVG